MIELTCPKGCDANVSGPNEASVKATMKRHIESKHGRKAAKK